MQDVQSTPVSVTHIKSQMVPTLEKTNLNAEHFSSSREPQVSLKQRLCIISIFPTVVTNLLLLVPRYLVAWLPVDKTIAILAVVLVKKSVGFLIEVFLLGLS